MIYLSSAGKVVDPKIAWASCPSFVICGPSYKCRDPPVLVLFPCRLGRSHLIPRPSQLIFGPSGAMSGRACRPPNVEVLYTAALAPCYPSGGYLYTFFWGGTCNPNFRKFIQVQPQFGRGPFVGLKGPSFGLREPSFVGESGERCPGFRKACITQGIWVKLMCFGFLQLAITFF